MKLRHLGGMKRILGGVASLAMLALASAAYAQAPTNDNCSNAADALIGFYYYGYTTFATLDGSTSCADSASPDVWFKFTPAASTRVSIYTCYNTDYDTIISLHSSCPGTAANTLVCDDDGCGSAGGPSYMEANVQAGVTYYVRVSGFVNNGVPSAGYYELYFYDLGVPTTTPSPSPSPTGGVNTPSPTASPTPSPSPTGPVPSPSPSPTGGPVVASDNCSDAPAVQLDTVYAGTTAGATLDGATTCDGATAVDVWFKYMATESKTLNFNLCNVNYDAVLSLHSACPGTAANSLACSDDGCGVQGGGGFISGPVQAGTTYYIRISGYNGATGQYQFIIEDPHPNRPEIVIDSETLRFSSGKPKIHVEIDWMQDATHNYQPEQAVLDAITDTFAQEGFDITLELSEAIPYQAVIAVANDGPSASPDVQAIKNAHFNHINDPGWSYSIWGNNYSLGGVTSGSSGIADLPGTTFLVTLGSFTNGVGLFSHKVGTFVHEFGHTMGQKHGGIDHNNWKPNYLSIMNYFYQLDGIPTSLTNLGFATNPTGFNTFGYSRGTQAPLDENNLNENIGLGLNKAIDWDCGGTATGTGVAKDIGGAGHSGPDWCGVNGSKEVLTDFDNWGDIPNYIQLGAAGAMPPSGPSTPCISWDEYSAFHAQLEQKAQAEGRKLAEAPTGAGYGGTNTGAPPNQRTFTIQNVGMQPLQITSITPSPAAAYLSISPPPPFTIAAQSQQVVTVTVNFSLAPAGETTTRLLVASNDADENPYPGQVSVVTRNITGVTPTPSPSPSPTATPTGDGRSRGDYDNSGCTDLTDFLFLLDYWTLVSPIGGDAIGLGDFLTLLDNWQLGATCP